ncbi:hypothetical protein EV194_101273 [Natronoflexus pectinivorans]|uniref:Uncharacterized protein n=1 Tax=Natronoflexus pectinivorans TaxID=682526 RepID=A0A4R2GMX8_9BACT|nr:hypothetical protein EV194_101273 [Natronoflexus pectinivorans]
MHNIKSEYVQMQFKPLRFYRYLAFLVDKDHFCFFIKIYDFKSN